MAAFDTSRPLAVNPAARITKIVANAFGALASWNDVRNTRKSLYALSARELEDIGLSYSDIDAVANRNRF